MRWVADPERSLSRLHPFTVTRLAREGKLPGFKVGGSWRFRKDQFEKWVEKRANGNSHDRPKRKQRTYA